MKVITLDWKELSEDAYWEIKRSLRSFGVHFGDVEYEYYGKAISSTYIIYINKRKLSRKELEKKFPFLLEHEDNNGENNNFRGMEEDPF